MSFSTLPDLCIGEIFDRIPLSDLLGTVNLVCHRWNANRLFACHRRRVLILAPTKKHCASLFGICRRDGYDLIHQIVNDDGTPYAKPSSAQLCNQISKNCVQVYFVKTNFTDEMCAKLIQLLPNIRQLSINLTFIPNWTVILDRINILFAKYAQQLTSLKLGLYDVESDGPCDLNDVDYDAIYINQLIVHLNTLVKLKRLEIYLNINEYSQPKINEQLQILQHLEYFDYFCGCREIRKIDECFLGSIASTLRRNEDQNVLRELSLNLNVRFDQLIELCSQTPQVYSRVIQLNASLVLPEDLRQFQTKMAQFTSLRRLTCSGASFDQLIRSIAQCQQLVELKIWNRLNIPEANENTKVYSLPSVRILDFSLNSNNHRDFGRAQIATTFPKVQFVKLEYLIEHCTDCGYDTKLDPTLLGDVRLEGRRPSQPMFQRCSRLAIESLKSCAKLRRILLYSRFREGGNRVDTVIDNPQENL